MEQETTPIVLFVLIQVGLITLFKSNSSALFSQASAEKRKYGIKAYRLF